MNISTIKDLAYLIQEAKENNLPKPIVFLGAGASKTGNIPLAYEIVEDILKKYPKNTKIQKLSEANSKDYSKLMECLTQYERNKLLNDYIDNANINVTHIYLAQLMSEEYVDYVLTVNFDYLMLRALALFNYFPPTYDLSNLKDLTTSRFKEKSVVYLHGQHHGLWLLNTPDEMAKVNEVVPPILNSIKNGRPWIFIGYSGGDPIFNHIIKLGAFVNGLYWITLYDKKPEDNVCNDLLDKPLTSSYLIKGYDADSFMLELCTELKLEQPFIIDKPFTALKHTLSKIVDIDDKEHFKGVKARLEIAKKNVDTAILQFEEGKITNSENLTVEINIGLLKKQIIDIIINEDFDSGEIQSFEEAAKALNNEEINSLIANLFNTWGIVLSEIASSNADVDFYEQSFEKFKKAARLSTEDDFIYYNWGTAIYSLANLKSDFNLYELSLEKFKKATELNSQNSYAYHNWGNAIVHMASLENNKELYIKSFEKFKIAIELNPKYGLAYNSWGIAIYSLAKLMNDEILYKQSFEKFKKAIELNSKHDMAYTSWGVALSNLGDLKNAKKSSNRIQHYIDGIEKFKKAIEINPKNDLAYTSWGITLYSLANLENNEQLYTQSFEKFKKAIEINTKNNMAYNNWGIAIYYLAKLKKVELLYEQSFEKFQKAIELNPKYDSAYFYWGNALYDLAKQVNDKTLYRKSFKKFENTIQLNSKNDSAYNNWGNAIIDLAKLTNEEELYIQSFEKFQKAIEINSDYDNAYINWGNAIYLLAKQKSSEELYRLSFEKYEKAIKVNPKNEIAYSNWGIAISDLAILKNDEKLFEQSLEKATLGFKLGGKSYNLACIHAKRNDRNKALKFLDISLKNKEVTITYIKNDDDWKLFLDNPNFTALLTKYNQE